MEVFLPVWYLECLNLTAPASFAFCIFVTGPLFCIVRTHFFSQQPTEVSDCIIWFLWEWIWSGYQISLTTIKQQLAYVYLQIAPNVAQHKCSAQVPNGANGAQQWSQEPIVQDQLRTWPGWLGAELGPDEIFLDAAYFHISLIGGLVVHQTLPCGLGLHKYAWTNLGPRQWLKFWTTTMCIWVFAFGYSDELRTCTCHVCRER